MMPFASARTEIADFLEALVLVYTLLLIAYIVASIVFSVGGRVPYTRVGSAVLTFLRDVSEPYLRLFRGLPLRIGPLDLTPMVAILLLQIVGAILVGLVRG